jgi:hypothetical protein
MRLGEPTVETVAIIILQAAVGTAGTLNTLEKEEDDFASNPGFTWWVRISPDYLVSFSSWFSVFCVFCGSFLCGF